MQNYFRDYDPAIGRYVESDSVGLVGGTNTYAYVANNALSFVDPKGMDIYCPGQTSVVDPHTHVITCVGTPRIESPQCPDGLCAGLPASFNAPPTTVSDCAVRCAAKSYVEGFVPEHIISHSTEGLIGRYSAALAGLAGHYVRRAFLVSFVYDVADCVQKCKEQNLCKN
jgi:hypothetical protein